MKKVMINAYTQFNLGDDLFIKVLCDRYPNTKFILFAPKEYKHLFSTIENLKIISSSSYILKGIEFLSRKIIGYSFIRKQIAKNCNASVYIGGSLFMQNDNWRESLEYVRNMKIKNQPFFLLGANFGPFEDKGFFLGYREIFKGYTDICFREKYSYNLFKELGNVRIADDIIFQLKNDISQLNQKNNIVISVIKPSIRRHLKGIDDIYYKKIKDISIYFIDMGFEVTLMSFCEHEGDKEAIDIIDSLIPEKYKTRLYKYYYKLNINEALDLISNSKFIVATRFHSMILGWLYDKPVFPIVYSDKMTNVMNDVGFNGAYCDINRISSLSPEEVYNSVETNSINVINQVINADKHFEKLDKYLLNGI